MTKQITIRMPKELLAKWLAALRSGEYAQAHGGMRGAPGSYCCLGVLAMVGDADESEFCRGTPSPDFLECLGIRFAGRLTDPRLPSLGKTASVANDSGATFAEIADAIEACAEGF